MQAVIKSGGKQYKVAKGDVLRVEKIQAEEGQSIDISDVLMVIDGDNITIGKPTIEGATVQAKVTAHGRGRKVNIIKFHRRKHYRRQMGHRQAYTELAIEEISVK